MDREREQRIAILLNAYSGPGRRSSHAQLVELLHEAGVSAQIFPARTGHAIRTLAEQAVREGFDVLVAAGGDGTASAVASVAAESGKSLGVLPMGTLNHFAQDAGIPTDLAAAIEILKPGRTTLVDLASVNGRSFLNTSSIGVYPRLAMESERYRRSGFGRRIAMGAAALRQLREFRSVYLRLAAEERNWEGFTPFVFVGNNPYTLEASRIGSRLSLETGQLWVCTTFESSRWGFLRLAADAWLGRAAANPDFKALTTTELWVDSRRRRLFVSRDGEVELMNTPLRYTIHPRALQVVVP